MDRSGGVISSFYSAALSARHLGNSYVFHPWRNFDGQLSMEKKSESEYDCSFPGRLYTECSYATDGIVCLLNQLIKFSARKYFTEPLTTLFSMKIKNRSHFKNIDKDTLYLKNWVARLEQLNQRMYERIEVSTALGKTHIWGLNVKEDHLETLVIFPGARTTALFWDFDRGLDQLNKRLRIFMVETNGLPNFSEGNSPDIKSLDYGHWAAEVLEKLDIRKTFVAGASFGALICMKLAIVSPHKVKAVFMLNPGCLQSFSMKWKNLYYNILPIVNPTPGNVLTFLNKAVFSKPNHQLSRQAEQLIVDYEVFALKRYKDRTQKPYAMGEELLQVKADAYLLEGNKDLLFPHQRSIDNAIRYVKTLKDVKVFENVGHGIETYDGAMNFIGSKINDHHKCISKLP